MKIIIDNEFVFQGKIFLRSLRDLRGNFEILLTTKSKR